MDFFERDLAVERVVRVQYVAALLPLGQSAPVHSVAVAILRVAALFDLHEGAPSFAANWDRDLTVRPREVVEVLGRRLVEYLAGYLGRNTHGVVVAGQVARICIHETAIVLVAIRGAFSCADHRLELDLRVTRASLCVEGQLRVCRLSGSLLHKVLLKLRIADHNSCRVARALFLTHR